ncbi:hypothetical protein [Adlercreutzia shanghongiae]|uniref:DUF4446 family protein n=1 Tax=Adlercreutzia shanghongiae TaxID=3111773 RepID=A0ABU6J0H2_9ACTN|nr:hypothetical protein [Adlercreutzia sp. R22]MEC4295611.1 hypothetical protein [Adlercreutzia sp. R22]
MLAGILTMLLAVFIAVALIVLMVVAIRLALRHIKSSNVALKATTQLMDQRVARLKVLAATCEDAELAQQIERAADDLRFLDSSVVLSVDGDIDREISRLESRESAGGVSGAFEAVHRLEDVVKRRSCIAESIRRGSF